MATQSFTISQLDPLPDGYPLDGSELWLTSVLSGATLRSFKASTYQLNSYFVTQGEWKDEKTKSGQVIAYGTYYVNGDTRERIFSLHEQDADAVRGSLQVDPKGVSYNKYLHSANIHVDTKYDKIYFCRGTWPRRQGEASTDTDGQTWRELGGRGEAICRTNIDGTGFEIVKDLESLGQDYYEPSAVVFDNVHDYIFFSCRNDHNKSRIYRMDMDGSNLVLWVEMATNDVNIDCLDVAHIPEDFFAAANPACTTTYLYFGFSPDYVSSTHTAKYTNAALMRVPVIGTAPGALSDNYTGKYCIHRFWHSSYKHYTQSSADVPDMQTTGIKGIKVFISNTYSAGTTNIKFSDGKWVPWAHDTNEVTGASKSTYQHGIGYGAFGLPQGFNVSKEWIPSMSKEAVARDRSRIYVVHSGARNVKRDQTEVNTPGSGGSGVTAPPIPDIPSQHAIDPTTHGHGYGGNSVLELLVGEPAGNPASFSVSDDATRAFKTWREGTIYVSGSIKVIDMGNDDPGMPTDTIIGSGTGSGRGIPWVAGDHLFISTSPSQTSSANGAAGHLDSKSGRGIRRIVGAVGNQYSLANTDNTTNGPGEIGKVMVIPVIASNLIGTVATDNADAYGGPGAIRDLALFGLQDITINPCTLEIFFTDFFSSAYYLRNVTFSQDGADYVPGTPAVPGNPYIPANPPNPTIPGNPPNPTIPGHVQIPGNPPTPAGPYNPLIPGNVTIPANPPIPGSPGNPQIPGSPGNPAVPAQPTIPANPPIPAVVGVSYRITQPDDSYYGTIYRSDSFTYGRGKNGQNLFNRFTHIGYNRPCGIGGYSTGPWNEFRLIYTNGETQLLTPTTLTTDTYTHLMAARGREVNGLSQVFTRDHVLAAGRNIFAIHDFGFGTFNGLLVTLEKPASTGDYAVLAQASNGDTLTIPTLHIQSQTPGRSLDAQTGTTARSVADTLQFLVDDPSLYQAKNSRQFRICYPDKITGLENLSWNVDPKTVNTIFFEVIH